MSSLTSRDWNLKLKIKKLLDKIKTPAFSTTTETSTSTSITVHNNDRLKIALPKFDGRPLEWRNFHSLFIGNLGLDNLLDLGTIEPSQSVWASPIVPIPKADGSVRVCVDYRDLNAVTPQIRNWLPGLSEILEKAGSTRVFSKLDLAKGYLSSEGKKECEREDNVYLPLWQIPVQEGLLQLLVWNS